MTEEGQEEEPMPPVLARARASDIRTDPFPHIVIPDALPSKDYTRLAAAFPPFERIAGKCSGQLPSNRRHPMLAHSILRAPDLADCWKAFVRQHSGPAFLERVGELFRGYWPTAILAELEGRFSGHTVERLNLAVSSQSKIMQDARIEINTPVHGAPSSSRGPHLDQASRIFSGLFYMRAPEDDSEGGELVLYRWKRGGVGNIGAYELPGDDVEAVVRIPYRANQLVLFPQGIDALHGVGMRYPTPHFRRYVFITAELDHDWLYPPRVHDDLGRKAAQV
ncbi:2OG-Fe(II) oxygenase [Novosphingobium beihaiensis]|uniref:2OG-Fe(II) oxygenase n=1 Tax=Novosphingobium beihaiensis TaxID=2930389 RepID=A0ABT0BK24_9SPHN|nr:2OG-Fe(II) oxygenase [Novosphingobium beihaiensis]MCJ2185394.1 2OG-Fe(II) oxygenase [Novosphingobium beihaiensis]